MECNEWLAQNWVEYIVSDYMKFLWLAGEWGHEDKGNISPKRKRKRGALDRDWVRVTPNQDFNGVEGDLEGVDGEFGTFCRGVWTVDVDTGLSSVLAGAFCSTGPDTTEGVEGGARAPSTGLSVMKGAEYIVWGVCPSSLAPSKGLEVGRMRINALVNVSRFCKTLSDGHRPRTRVCSWSSCQAVRMTQGSDVELGGSNVKPRLLRRYAGWLTI